MKKIKVSFAIIALLVSNVALADLNTGLVAYYPFNGNANDESLNGNDGTVYGATLIEDRFKNSNSAYYFNGSSYIDLKFMKLPIGNTERTISLLVNLDKSSRGNFFSYGTPTEWQTFGLRYWLNTSTPTLALMGFDATGSGADFGIKAALKPSVWSMVSYVYKNATLSVYLNGKLIISHTFSQSHNTGTTNAFIGKSIHFGYEDFMKGSLDNIRIYNRALSASEIKSLYYVEFPAVIKGNIDWAKPPYNVICENSTNNTQVTINNNKNALYDCEKAGLTVNSGDRVKVTIDGLRY